MSWSRTNLCAALPGLLLAGFVHADGHGYVIGGGAESDTAGGRAVSVFADRGLAENTWLTGAAARTETGRGPLSLDTLYVDAGLDHWFDPAGVRIAAAYWGDKDILDSVDLRGSLYFRNDTVSLSLDYKRRDFDLTFSPSLIADTRTVEFYADGIGLTSRVQASKRVSLTISGMSYQYSRDINLQPRIEILRILSTSRLSLMNSLIDYRYSAGIEFRFGLQSIDFRLQNWQTAVDQGRVNSLAIGFLTPVSDRTDMEFRFAYDESENFGNTVSLAAYFYYFGG